MKICLISKYPPIEGGVSSRTYWLAKALGEGGHKIHIVTNAWEVEDEYRERIEADELKKHTYYQPQNVYVHNTGFSPELKHIPYSKSYVAKIASLAIDVIEKYNLQLIDSWYILPYAISGFLAKVITNRPQIMRHAGSDMYKLLKSPYLRTLFLSLFKGVDKIVTYPSAREKFLSFGIPESRLTYNGINVDTRAFNPKVKPIDLSKYTNRDINGLTVITYIGKINVVKGIYELIEAASKIKKDFLLLFVCGGKGLEEFKKFIHRKRIQNKTLFIDFLPPWKIPSVIKRSTCIVMLERDFPIAQHGPVLLREVMAVGRCVILSNELYAKRCSQDICDGENVIIVDPKDIPSLRKILERIIKNPLYAREIGKRARLLSGKIERFDEYVNDNIRLYEKVLDSHKVRKWI